MIALIIGVVIRWYRLGRPDQRKVCDASSHWRRRAEIIAPEDRAPTVVMCSHHAANCFQIYVTGHLGTLKGHWQALQRVDRVARTPFRRRRQFNARYFPRDGTEHRLGLNL
jgi:hypothetical protein